MSFVDSLLARVGKTRADVKGNARKLFRTKGVRESAELDRVVALPRRQWTDTPDSVREYLNSKFARARSNSCNEKCVCGGTGSMELWPVQAAALADLHDHGGLFAPMQVGAGKTLTSFLAQPVTERSELLLVPANMKKKTERDFARLLVHWRLSPVRIETYERFGVVANKHLLSNIKPGLIFADEGHRLKNTKARVTKVVKRYLEERKDTYVAVASGTLTTRQIREYWHILRWCLGDGMCPLPVEWPLMMEWGEALDVETKNELRSSKMAPGALEMLCNEEECDRLLYGMDVALETVRGAYQRRLSETPGVISTIDTKGCPASLFIKATSLDISHLDPVFEALREDWQTPDGWEFSQASDLWMYARQIACGFYLRWDPRPPKPWARARSNWHRYCRQILKSHPQWDTDLEVAQAVVRGDIDGMAMVRLNEESDDLVPANVYQEWHDIKDSFKPNSVPVWIDDTALKYAAEWMKEGDGIVWVESPWFGEELSRVSGRPFFGSGDEGIEETTGPIIASVLAHGTGRNLQHYSRNLVVSCYPNGKQVEQLLGRTHRPGQKSDEVTFEFLTSCREQVEGLDDIGRQSRYICGTFGTPMKWLIADKELEVEQDGGARWA